MIEQSDRAVMLDEVIEYVKFLRLQVKVIYVICFAFQINFTF